jgi:hypothetical protein
LLLIANTLGLPQILPLISHNLKSLRHVQKRFALQN